MKVIVYELADEDRALLEEVLGLAQRTVDLQYDEETADELQQVLLDVADMFAISSSTVNVEVAEDGTITAKVVEETQDLPDTRSGLQLVSDNSDRVIEFKSKNSLPPGFELTKDKDFKLNTTIHANKDKPYISDFNAADKPQSGPQKDPTDD